MPFASGTLYPNVPAALRSVRYTASSVVPAIWLIEALAYFFPPTKYVSASQLPLPVVTAGPPALMRMVSAVGPAATIADATTLGCDDTPALFTENTR